MMQEGQDPEAIQIGEPEKEIVFEPMPLTEPAPEPSYPEPTPQEVPAEPEKVPAGQNAYGWGEQYEDDPYASGIFG